MPLQDKFIPNAQAAYFSSLVYPTTTPSTIATAGAVTYATSDLLGGLILRDTAGAARSDVTPTAAALVAALQGARAGLSFEFSILNNSGAANAVTVTAGAGVTLSGTMTVAQNNIKRFLARVTNATPGSEAVTVYSLGTSTF